MANEAKKDAKGKAELAKKAVPAAPKPLTPLETLHSHIATLEKFVDTRDTRFLTRVLRYINHLRGTLSSDELKTAITTYVLDATRSASLLELLALVSPKRIVAVAPKVCICAYCSPCIPPW